MRRTRRTVLGHAAVGAATALLTVSTAVVALAPTAFAQPPAVSSVLVQGDGATPLAVSISWVAPSDQSYAGARVVVVRGSTPTNDPADTTAVNRQDVGGGTTTAIVGSLSSGQAYAATVFSYDSAGAFSSGSSATWTEPAPVSGFGMRGTDRGGGLLEGNFTPAAGMTYDDPAVVCLAKDAAPPSTPAPPALCYERQPVLGKPYVFSIPAQVGHTYGLSAFSRSPTAGYGPPVTQPNVAVSDVAPEAWSINVGAVSRSAHSVTLTWGDSSYLSPPLTDLKEVLVTRALGVKRPSPDAPVYAVVPLRPNGVPGSHTFTGLTTNQAYMFSLRFRDLAGHLSDPVPVTSEAPVAPHTVGGLLTDNATSHRRWRTTRVTALPSMARFGVSATGQVHVVSTGRYYDDPRYYYRWRAPQGAWSRPVAIGNNEVDAPPILDVTRKGRVAAAWDTGEGPAVRTRQVGHPWGKTIVLPSAKPSLSIWWLTLVDLTQDSHNRLHLLAQGQPLQLQPGDGLESAGPPLLVYATNVTGRWTFTKVTDWTPASHAALAHDSVNDTIVVAVSGEHLLLARKSRTSTSFPRLSTVPTPGVGFALSDVAALAGRIVVAGSGYVLIGTTASRMGKPTRVLGAGDDPSQLRVALASPADVLLAWPRASSTWNPAQQGVFLRRMSYSKTLRQWTLTRPRQLSNCHYDEQLTGVSTDGAGHVYVGFNRS